MALRATADLQVRGAGVCFAVSYDRMLVASGFRVFLFLLAALTQQLRALICSMAYSARIQLHLSVELGVLVADTC